MNDCLHPALPSHRTIYSDARRRGLAMAMVMIALAVGTIIVLTFLSGQTTSMAIAHNASRQTQARAIAEDGLSLVLEHLRADTDWRDGQTHGDWNPDQTLNGGRFRAMLEDEVDGDLGNDVSEPFTVTVEGTYRGVVHRAAVRVTPTAQRRALTVMLVAGETPVGPEDQLRVETIESWGYRVVTVADDASNEVYAAAAAQADVIYVSEEVSSSPVGDRLNALPVGVVNEEQAI
ncbi:MAG: hypothetical protein AAGL98_02510, partial [Planctomycetota bacterium]